MKRIFSCILCGMGTAQAQAAPAEEQLYDIHGPVVLSTGLSSLCLGLMVFVLVLLVLLGLSGLLLYLRRQRTQKHTLVQAHELALFDLVRAEQMMEEEQLHAFITLIDQILRRYLEQRFNLTARRQTSRELIHTLERRDIPESLLEYVIPLKHWLERCDTVKFAQAGLSTAGRLELVADLRAFIQSSQTKAAP
jgi:hypothetical protein